MKERLFDLKNRINNYYINNNSEIVKEERIVIDKALNDIKHYYMQRNFENSRTRYTISAIVERIKKELAIITFDLTTYLLKIEKEKKGKATNHCYYDYDLELDFSIDTQEPKSIENKIYDDRSYYYKAHHFLKLGLFLDEDAPVFKVKISDLSPDMVYELTHLAYEDRKFVLKQAVSRIFEDVNFDLYHNSISDKLEVKLVE